MFRQSIGTAGSTSSPITGFAAPIPGRSSGRTTRSRCGSTARSSFGTGELSPVPGRPSTLIGIPFDRPVVGYGGKTINTLRLWAATSPDYFDFQAFSHGEFVSALAGSLAAKSLTRVLYPDDSTTRGQGLRFIQEYFLVACSLADLIRRFRRSNAEWSALPDRAAIQLNDTHPYNSGCKSSVSSARGSSRVPVRWQLAAHWCRRVGAGAATACVRAGFRPLRRRVGQPPLDLSLSTSAR